jgi:hypothetical protein
MAQVDDAGRAGYGQGVDDVTDQGRESVCSAGYVRVWARGTEK